MDVFPAIRVVEGDGGQGIDHVEGLEEGVRENFVFCVITLCDHSRYAIHKLPVPEKNLREESRLSNRAVLADLSPFFARRAFAPR